MTVSIVLEYHLKMISFYFMDFLIWGDFEQSAQNHFWPSSLFVHW